MSTNGFHLSWPTAPGVTYQVEYTTNLFQPNRIDLIPPFVASSETFSIVDTNSSSSSQQYYRLALP